MIVRELKNLSYGGQYVEIANPVEYYFGRVRDIPMKLLSLKVVYIAAGRADSNKQDNVLLIDAKEVKE